MYQKSFVNVEKINELFALKHIDFFSGFEEGSTKAFIRFKDESSITMYHAQDCCESVSIEDISGVNNLVDSIFYEIIEKSCDRCALNEYDESFTWTFYTIVTSNGYIDIRWYGTSNGYYSESVDFSIQYKKEN